MIGRHAGSGDQYMRLEDELTHKPYLVASLHVFDINIGVFDVFNF